MPFDPWYPSRTNAGAGYILGVGINKKKRKKKRRRKKRKKEKKKENTNRASRITRKEGKEQDEEGEAGRYGSGNRATSCLDKEAAFQLFCPVQTASDSVQAGTDTKTSHRLWCLRSSLPSQELQPLFKSGPGEALLLKAPRKAYYLLFCYL
jgi:hypothetical protein